MISCSTSSNNCLLLEEVFVISRTIEVEVGVISPSRRLRLITLTKPFIILDITKTESNNYVIIIVLLYIERKKLKSLFCFFADTKQHKACALDMITLRNHAPRSYMTWLPVTLTWLLVTLTWLLYNLQLWRHWRCFWKFTVRFQPIRKEIASSMYNECCYHMHLVLALTCFHWSFLHKMIHLAKCTFHTHGTCYQQILPVINLCIWVRIHSSQKYI